jgi:outer membrane protein
MKSGAGSALITFALILLGGNEARADVAASDNCTGGECHYRLTAEQLLAKADSLVSEHRFAEAAPLLAALEQVPSLSMEREFLQGYSAVESGKLDDAIKIFRRILNTHPDQTRVRLELGRALMLQGKTMNADHHFRLAAEAKDLPQDVADTIRASRGALKLKRNWGFNFDFGIAPDSNITNGTAVETVDVNVGPFVLPLTLDGDARKRSGTGQFATANATARSGFVGETRLLVEGGSQITNYKGKGQDDLTTDLAIGPELDIGADTTLSLQGLSANRWYGGQHVLRSFGLRAGLQHELSPSQRFGLSIDARQNHNAVTAIYSGWQYSGLASYERVIGRRFIASASMFGRRDALNAAAFSDTEVGGNLGIGGELPLGITAGISAGASRAWYDAPMSLFSDQPRKDWRLNGRVQIGLRSLRMLGFSPSIAYNYSASLSSLSIYDSKRSRVRFALARYF